MIKNNVDSKVLRDLQNISRTMFKKDCFNIFQGSISHKLNETKFIINTKDAVFDDLRAENLVILSHKRDYSYNEASSQASLHSYIYKEIAEAKCFAYALPPYALAYSLQHLKIIPKDYYGAKVLKEINIYNPKSFDSWEERADTEVGNFLKQNNANFVVVRGYGIYAYGRDLMHLAKTITLIENSARILTLYNLENTLFKYKLELTSGENTLWNESDFGE